MAEKPQSLTQFLNACNREQLQKIAIVAGQSPDSTVEVLRSTLNVYFRSHPEELNLVPGMERLVLTKSTPSPSPTPTGADVAGAAQQQFQLVPPLTPLKQSGGSPTTRPVSPTRQLIRTEAGNQMNKFNLHLEIPVDEQSTGNTPPRTPPPPPPLEGTNDTMRAFGDLFNVVMARSDERLAAILRANETQQQVLMDTTLQAVRQIADQAVTGAAVGGEPMAGGERTSRNSSSLGAFLKVAQSRHLRFTGRDNESFAVFVKLLNDTLALFRLNDADKRRALGDLVSGSARHVFDHLDGTSESFAEVITSMKNVYISPDRQMQLKMTLLTRMQGEHERSVHWLMVMKQLNEDLESKLTQAELLSTLRAHLHPKVLALLCHREHARFEDLVADASGADAIIERQKSYVPPTRAMLNDVLYGDSNTLFGTAPKPQVLAVRSSPPEIEAMSQPRTSKDRKSNFKSNVPAGEHTCKGCGIKGHYEKDCLTTPRPFCYFCGHHGVIAAQCDCRQRRGSRVTIDSSASQAERALYEEFQVKLEALKSQQGN